MKNFYKDYWKKLLSKNYFPNYLKEIKIYEFKNFEKIILSENNQSLNLLKNVFKGQSLIIKNVFNKKEILRLKESIFKIEKNTPEKNYKMMDISNSMLEENDKKYLTQVVETNEYNYLPDQFVAFYNEDKLGGMIRNVEFWVKDIFEKFKL